jgi:tetratricopeptide repeat protein
VSRLADRLMGMDERRATRPGLGGIPHLGESAEPRRQWLIVGTLVILVLMGIFATGIVLRPHPISSRSVVAPIGTATAADTAATQTPRAVSVADRVARLTREGTEAAQGGQMDEAAIAFRKAADLDPTDAEAWNSLGVLLVRTGDAGKGIECFRRALRAAPGHSEAHRNLAVALDRQGRVAEATRHYRAFLSQKGAGGSERAQVLARLEELGARRAGE